MEKNKEKTLNGKSKTHSKDSGSLKPHKKRKGKLESIGLLDDIDEEVANLTDEETKHHHD